MKSILQYPVVMALILSSVSLSAQNVTATTQKITVVYEADTSQQTAILERDYPETAANFSALFPGASNQLWLKEGNSLFVYFLNTGKKVTAVFSSKGRMHYSVTIIDLSAVPEIIRDIMKKEYPSFSFFSGKQIQAGGYTAYELIIENSYEYISLSTTDGDEVAVGAKIRKTFSNEKLMNRIP